jgi:1,4-dihydroxy-6-naphthoate synthase
MLSREHTARIESGRTVRSKRSLTLAYTPGVKDTHIFSAWSNGLLDGAPRVQVALDSVEALNAAAFSARYAVTRAAYGAVPLLMVDYRILRAGGVFVRDNGPVLAMRGDASGAVPSLAELPHDLRIAIPGTLMTSYLLLRLAMGRQPNVTVMRFDRIPGAVARGEVDAGVIVDEARLMRDTAELGSVVDFGEWWRAETGKPLPLGAMLVRRDVAADATRDADRAIRDSLAFARAHQERIAPFVRSFSHETGTLEHSAHLAVYVNDHTSDVGDDGIAAVEELFARGVEAGLVPHGTRAEFV